jgi:hypothetical protein
MPNPLKAAELHEESTDKKIHASLTLRPLEGRDGFAFGLVSVSGRGDGLSVPAASVVEHVDRLAQAFGKDANAQHRFEQFLSALNEAMSERVRGGDWNVPIQRFNAVVGIACDEQMFLSGTGDLTALFLHRTPERRYQVFNLFRSIQTEQALPTWEKPFAVVLDGDLHAGDVFCVSNRDLQRFVSDEDLNAILSTLPPKGAAAKIRQYFPANADLSVLILQAPDETAAADLAAPLASVSMDRFVRTKDETASLLEDQTPKPLSGLLEALRRMRAPAKRLAAGRSLWRLATSSASVSLRMVADAAKWTARTPTILLRRDARSTAFAAVRTGVDQGVRSVAGRFARLPKSTKALLVGSAVVFVALVAGITTLQRSQERSAEIAVYEASVAKVEKAVEKAAGAVIYKDESQARSLYGQALALANALPVDTEERAKAAASLQARINGALNELRHLANIPAPTILAELGASTTGRIAFSSNGGLYVPGSDTRLYLLDPSARSFVPVETSDGEVGVPTEAASEGGQTLFIDDRPGISRADLENKLLQITNVKPAAGSRWTDLALYGGKLYVLEPSSGQIVKYNRAGSGYDGGTRWVRAKTADLSDAVSLAIDATVFVLKRNGQMIRFVGGSEVGWTQGAVDPPVAAASDVWTSAESDYVYVLDPGTRRLIVYGKEDGDLVTQYRSDAFDALADFVVDEQNRIIYLLSGPRLYSITASHLK